MRCKHDSLSSPLMRVLWSTLCRWGYPFLYESYLYHLHRLDHRHNFSPYFYLTYLTYPSLSEVPKPLPLWNQILRSPLTSFVPQMGLALGLGLLFGRRKEDLVFTWFVQTVVFVVFNKVCTSQVRISNTFKRVLLIGIRFGSTFSGFFYCYHCSFHGCRLHARKPFCMEQCGWAPKPCGLAKHTNLSSWGRTYFLHCG